MVCIDVASKIKEEDVLVHFRDSMDKFDSSNRSIDIVRASHNAPAFLNRQIILLLSSLGIKDQVFLSLQRCMVKNILEVTKSSTSAEDTLLEMNGEGGGNGTHHFMIEYLRRFGLKTEPFVRQMLLCFQSYQLKELRTKSRIFVRDGSCLLGVIDESKTLEYGQVFIQIEQNHGQYSTSHILKGPVIVTRNPCFHPGKNSFDVLLRT
jgi:RNA-dependent RNA polymerase